MLREGLNGANLWEWALIVASVEHFSPALDLYKIFSLFFQQALNKRAVMFIEGILHCLCKQAFADRFIVSVSKSLQ